jgi:hypothetical protein
MRPSFVIVGLVVAAALVAFLPRLGGNDPHPPDPEHRESVAAAYALAFARWTEVGRADGACRSASAELAREWHCDSADPRIPSCGGFDLDGTLVNDYSETRAEIDVGSCTIELTQGREDWVVSDVVVD